VSFLLLQHTIPQVKCVLEHLVCAVLKGRFSVAGSAALETVSQTCAARWAPASVEAHAVTPATALTGNARLRAHSPAEAPYASQGSHAAAACAVPQGSRVRMGSAAHQVHGAVEAAAGAARGEVIRGEAIPGVLVLQTPFGAATASGADPMRAVLQADGQLGPDRLLCS